MLLVGRQEGQNWLPQCQSWSLHTESCVVSTARNMVTARSSARVQQSVLAVVKAIQIQKKQVQQVKATNNISFVEARRKVESEAASHRPTIAAIISRPVSACTSLKHNVQTQTIISWLRHQAHQLKHLMLSHKQKQKHPLDRIGRTGSAPSAQIPPSHHHILLTEGTTNLLLVKIKITTNPKLQT